jgi:hypothetical protein
MLVASHGDAFPRFLPHDETLLPIKHEFGGRKSLATAVGANIFLVACPSLSIL